MARSPRNPLALAALRPRRRTTMLLLGSLPALAAASLFASGPTGGAQQDGVTIPYGDIDLSTVEGAVEFERRLLEAAHTVCAELDSTAVPHSTFERCRMDAVAGAILILRRPAVAATVSS